MLALAGFRCRCQNIDVVGNNVVTFVVGVVAADLRTAGRVPEDVSVVGVDDSLDDFVAHNELTTVRFDLHQRGLEVFEHAVPEAGTAGKTVAIRIPGQLIVRHSTAAPRA